jgi:hypothetical protein
MVEVEINKEQLNKIYPNQIPSYLMESEYYKEHECLIMYFEITDVEKNNDGIGAYDFGGQRCYDAGVNYYEATNIELLEDDWKEAEGFQMLADDVKMITDFVLSSGEFDFSDDAEEFGKSLDGDYEPDFDMDFDDIY